MESVWYVDLVFTIYDKERRKQCLKLMRLTKPEAKEKSELADLILANSRYVDKKYDILTDKGSYSREYQRLVSPYWEIF